MSLKVTEAFLKPVNKPALTRIELIENRIHYLGEGIADANERKSEFFIIRGEVSDLLNMSDENLERLGTLLKNFAGTAVLFVADLHPLILSRFRKYVSYRVLFFPDDTNKNISIREILALMESLRSN